MAARGFLVFHLNLAFSSIPEEARGEVIRRCYFPLLEMIKTTGIPVGIELTGWSLERILELDQAWVDEFRRLLIDARCELVGSGYTQLIGPLVPASVNHWNQKLGLEAYLRHLGLRPQISLINEMAYSSSLVEIYQSAGYRGLIMDRDNVRLALGIEDQPISATPTHGIGPTGAEMPMLWADSLLFQKLQHYAHGDIRESDYFDYLHRRIGFGETLLPIYCNDAEIFDYRPGRFQTERPLHHAGEWKRIERLLLKMTDKGLIEWISPSSALAEVEQSPKLPQVLTSIAHPLPVKKQAKYNIARWAVTGRNDIWLNTLGHQCAQALENCQSFSSEDWCAVCELWASDYRTHITQTRWSQACQASEMLRERLCGTKKNTCREEMEWVSAENVQGYDIRMDNENILLTVKTENISITMNIRRGLTIKNLSFRSQDWVASVGTLPHGYFNSITLAADYYSGGMIIEIPGVRQRITDLVHVQPFFSVTEEKLSIRIEIPTELGTIRKVIAIPRQGEGIEFTYQLPQIERPSASVRVGLITLIPETFGGPLRLSCFNGGDYPEHMTIDQPCDHSAATSSMVSATTGVGASKGWLLLGDENRALEFEWNTAECAVLPMLIYRPVKEKYFARLLFSLQEIDDTSRPEGVWPDFSFRIKPGCLKN